MSTAFATRKITISLPDELIDFADQYAQTAKTNRSQIIGQILAEAKARAEANLAAEGYQFYAQEQTAFATDSGKAVAEAWSEETWLNTLSEEVCNLDGYTKQR